MTQSKSVAMCLVAVATIAVSAFAARAQGNPADTKPSSITATEKKISPQKEKSIRELIRVSNTEKQYKQAIRQMFAMYREQKTEVPGEVWDKMEAKFADVSEVLDALVPIYDKYYTQEDIDGLLTFYNSPVGKKYLLTLPAVQAEASAFGKEWGTRKGAEVDAEIRAAQETPKKENEE